MSSERGHFIDLDNEIDMVGARSSGGDMIRGTYISEKSKRDFGAYLMERYARQEAERQFAQQALIEQLQDIKLATDQINAIRQIAMGPKASNEGGNA